MDGQEHRKQVELEGGWGKGEKRTLQTVLNGRPEVGREMCVTNEVDVLFCLANAFTLIFARRVKGTGLRWGIYTFSFAFPFAFAFALAFSFSFAFGRGAYGMWEVGVIIENRAPKDRGGATAGFCREARADVEGRSGHRVSLWMISNFLKVVMTNWEWVRAQ